MEELIKGFEDSFTPNPIGVEQSMVYNFSEWIMKYISPMRKHSQPHVFKIFKVDRKAKIVCKQWTTDKVYKECVGSMDYLINEIPKDAPEAICPIYNELDKVKDSLTCSKPFMNSRQQTQWQNFFKDKEEEEFDFKAESNFKLLELSEYVKQKRLEKSRNYQPVTIPQIVTDDKDMEPVVIGKLTASKKSNNIKSLALEVGQMVLVDIEKYADEWPQVGQTLEIAAGLVKIHWYKGSKTGPWCPCTIPVPGKRGKRMPWIEEIRAEEIWKNNFNLTNKNCLTKQIRYAIDNYDN
ncbi:Hypothetical predicted protein [Mytilus galloprovincialis]|uniref:DUF7869 domain-containing protein n=1 Tax=Mytilus galloprovincialis TaxID=29158 RepID=A0A8B6E5D7_MYTGA|nr:Hypothetical predicted protein [Mytilus galloprovincialis]